MAVAFGKYQLLKKIGSGGMGQVFLARHAGAEGFEKLVVIKRILPHLIEDEDFLTMFLDEARLAARLNHPNLIQIFDLGEANRSHYLAMEYCQGDDLRKLDRYARSLGEMLPVEQALRIISDAAAGLDYAHKARDAQGKPLGLVHRDVSPQNILVGFDGAVKLIDFGVAKAAGRAQHTGTGILKGKYPYMSPEQAEGRALDGRSDIFALGVVFWEILTGKRLFKADSDLATMRLVVDCQVPPPSKINPNVPQALDTIVLQALARSPEERFKDAQRFRLAIEDFITANRMSASSAHLASYMSELYADRIEQDADPSSLDELQDGNDPDMESQPSSSAASRQNWRESPPRPGSKSVAPVAKGSASKRAPRPITAAGTAALPPEPKSKAGVWIAATAVLGLAAAGIAVVAMKEPPQRQVIQIGTAAPPAPAPPVVTATPVEAEPEPEKPAAVVVKLSSEPAGATVQIDGQAIGKTPLDYALEGDRAVVAVFSLQGFETREATLSAAHAPELAVTLPKKRTPNSRRPPPGPLGIKTDR